jgi:hypothetical protein
MAQAEVVDRDSYLKELPPLRPGTKEFLTKYIGLPDEELEPWIMKNVCELVL